MMYLLSNKKGQSLAELATFGVILISVFGILLNYGMTANYQQRVNMEAYRKAHVRARQGSIPDFIKNKRPWAALETLPAYGAAATFAPRQLLDSVFSGPSNNYKYVNYTVIEDKPVPNASGLFPVGPRTPIVGSGEAVCSINLFSEGPPISVTDPSLAQLDIRNLARAEYEINGQYRSYTMSYLSLFPDTDDIVFSIIGDKIPSWIMVEAGELGDWILPSWQDPIRDALDMDRDGIQGFRKTETDNSSLVRREDENGIAVTENINRNEHIKRFIRFEGRHYEVDSEFPTVRENTWPTVR
ncbi:MAG: hypothetical protein JW714_01100 [Candidatus Omnitrophica bacterium]|nr:hypothetical protein [Candidatus Omnitrophota bacterium]